MFENFLKHRTLPFFSNNSKTTMPKTPNVLQNQKQRTLQRKQRTIAKQQYHQVTPKPQVAHVAHIKPSQYKATKTHTKHGKLIKRGKQDKVPKPRTGG
jgi:hypothetical protein